jgi:hypothetical protein
MRLTNRVRTTSSIVLLLIGMGLFASCGGGGETTAGTETGSGFLLKNNGLTFGGAHNVHAIVSYTVTRSGNGTQISSGPVNLAPGDTAFVPVTTGKYTLSATFDDGHVERLQVPPDQVDAIAEEVTTVLFVY